MSARITEKRDRRLDILLKGASGRVRAGILSAGSDPHPGGVTVAQVAEWNEFGTETADGKVHVPARSFIRDYWDFSQPEIMAAARRVAERVLKGQIDMKQGLNQMGLAMVGGMQKRISAGIAPQNTESTVAKKGSRTPLVDTGQLRSSITYEVDS